MVWLPRVIAAVPLIAALLAMPPAAAQDSSTFLLLGEDAIEDAYAATPAGNVPMLDTWIDINGLAVATIGTDLVFHLGLQGTTTEVGSYCWMAAFEFDGTEYVGLDCYEGVAYESDNTLSSASAPSTSRGENVARSVTFDATGALITIPLSAIGASIGDVIDDIYGLTYITRALVVTDTVPDAKRTTGADESLGSYVIGGGSLGGDASAVYGNVTDGGFRHEFANATSATYVLNLTIPWDNATVRLDAGVLNGSANVTFLHNGTSRLSFLVTNATNATSGNGTATAAGPYSLANATGNWSIEVRYEGFVGHLSLNVTEAVDSMGTTTSVTRTTSGSATVAGNGTQDGAEDDGKEEQAPTPGFLLLALVLVAVALVRRRSSK